MVLIFRFLIAFLTAFSTTAFAYQVIPMYQALEIAGNKSRSSYQITNTRPKEAQVEIKVFQVEFTPDGEDLSPADSDFLILPPQLSIQPGRRQTVRMRYLGAEEIKETHIYRVIFSEVKTQDQERKTGGVELLLEFSTVVFVSPNDCSFKVRSWIKSGKMHFSNGGNCVVDLSTLRFELSNKDDDVRVYWHEINTTNLSSYLVPGRDKVVSLTGDFTRYDGIEVSE
ncbi:P pilus assembly protein [Vibrio ishigakensis]|uniref:P pilus assembly protein n=1 Tax=Vibrio ishigakensis TaxID=1481914 RepID=A0A0B8PKH7_9VIBR|nr:P pilus assembly protein [Vibrio ishigakensis]